MPKCCMECHKLGPIFSTMNIADMPTVIDSDAEMFADN